MSAHATQGGHNNPASSLPCTHSAMHGCCYQGEGQFEPRFPGMGSSLGIFFVSTKLDTFCYRSVQTAPCYVQLFWHNTGMWDRCTDGWTDGQTDGIAVASTTLGMQELRRLAVIKIIFVYHAVVHEHSVHVSPLNWATYYRPDGHN